MTAVWDGRKVVVAVGTGGVGKTTVSASIALAASASGLRTLVMTIDPARRLANALGLDDIRDGVHELDPERLRAAGIEVDAPLSAMMPDTKSTFDRIIERFAPSDERRQAILANPIYQHFSTALAGALEYAAVERLYEMHQSDRYDLIVLDTPPAQNVVDFLDAPNRVVDFLEQESLQWLLKPYSAAGRFGAKLFDIGGSILFKTLGRLAGADTLRALAEFVMGFQGMYDGFRDRASAVRSLLASEDVAFLLVGSTSPGQREAMTRFHRDLADADLSVRTVVLNRVRSSVLVEPWPEDWRSQLHALGISEAVLDAAAIERTLADRDADAVSAVDAALSVPVVALPELRSDVHDLESLARLYRSFMM
ncbi:MAG: ArsA-related P-loop ATPase [Myxococcota bacterium]